MQEREMFDTSYTGRAATVLRLVKRFETILRFDKNWSFKTQWDKRNTQSTTTNISKKVDKHYTILCRKKWSQPTAASIGV